MKKPVIHINKHEMNTKNIKKILKSEQKIRTSAKDIERLDKLSTEIMGPVGSKEWLNSDLELIGKTFY